MLHDPTRDTSGRRQFAECAVSPLSQFAWRRRAARSCEARRHEGHDVRGGELARGSPLEEDLVQQPLVERKY